MNLLSIFHQVEPTASKPYMLIELMDTTDGPRSRICDGRWKTIQEAHEEIGRRQQLFYKGLV